MRFNKSANTIGFEKAVNKVELNGFVASQRHR